MAEINHFFIDRIIWEVGMMHMHWRNIARASTRAGKLGPAAGQ